MKNHELARGYLCIATPDQILTELVIGTNSHPCCSMIKSFSFVLVISIVRTAVFAQPSQLNYENEDAKKGD